MALCLDFTTSVLMTCPSPGNEALFATSAVTKTEAVKQGKQVNS
jgi:hypothetical protein